MERVQRFESPTRARQAPDRLGVQPVEVSRERDEYLCSQLEVERAPPRLAPWGPLRRQPRAGVALNERVRTAATSRYGQPEPHLTPALSSAATRF